MPFKKGEQADGSTPFQAGESGNPSGRPKGILNRNTIARRILALQATIPSKLFNELKRIYPDLEKRMTFEEVMTIVQAKQAIKGDNQSYKLLMDSAYGAPKQEIDMTSEGERINPTVTIVQNIRQAPLAKSEKQIIIENGLEEDIISGDDQ